MTDIDHAQYKDDDVRKRKRFAPDLPAEVVQRLDGLFSREALEEALAGVSPEEITRPGGLITTLAGRVIDAALRAELTEHLGHPPGGQPAQDNIRNGGTAKTLRTDLGPVRITTPRDREGTFAPQLVGKRQTRLAGLDERILGL